MLEKLVSKTTAAVSTACWLLLQALFMMASVLRATSTTATRTMAKGFFGGDLASARTGRILVIQNEPAVNLLPINPGSWSSNAPLRKKSS